LMTSVGMSAGSTRIRCVASRRLTISDAVSPITRPIVTGRMPSRRIIRRMSPAVAPTALADADFARALADVVCDRCVEPHRGDEQRRQREHNHKDQ